MEFYQPRAALLRGAARKMPSFILCVPFSQNPEDRGPSGQPPDHTTKGRLDLEDTQKMARPLNNVKESSWEMAPLYSLYHDLLKVFF
jgi:hypothetical protein